MPAGRLASALLNTEDHLGPAAGWPKLPGSKVANVNSDFLSEVPMGRSKFGNNGQDFVFSQEPAAKKRINSAFDDAKVEKAKEKVEEAKKEEKEAKEDTK
mmetsp:Transcript_55949/g.99646  ORF Transcript_55949/g.99646 Transcript_55949/m.99646 type:complete len:100 (+) Transcript_55949:69-368(+)